MRKLIPLLPALILLVGFASCSDHLSNSKAEKIIKETHTFPEINSIRFPYGLVAHESDSLPRFYYILQKKGMLKIDFLGVGGFLVTNYRFRITPTPAGKKYIVEMDEHPLKQGGSGEFMYNSSFKTCEAEFGEIENVHEIPALNGADINYTVKRVNFTPFWSYYEDESKERPDTLQHRKMGVIKTTEGWGKAK